jgi:choline dehydrogenase-like flavoprotein
MKIMKTAPMPAIAGEKGEMTITNLAWRDPLCEAFIDGAESIGIPRNPDYNGAYQEGTSYVQRTSTGKLRMSACAGVFKACPQAVKSACDYQCACNKNSA